MKRWLWGFPVIAGIIAIAGLWYWGNGAVREKNQMLTYLNNRNQMSFYELVGNVQNVEAMLSKGIVSNSPRQRMLIFSDVWQKANAAQENLSQVPISGASFTRTSKFLAQTADYTWSLAKKYSRGEAISSDEMGKLNELHRQAGFLASELLRIEKTASDGRLSWSEISSSADRNLKYQSLAGGLQKIDKSMENFPTLIYDGPFSDHIAKRKPLGLTGAMINKDKAASIAKGIVETGSNIKYKVVRTDNVNGNIPAFRIHLVPVNKQTPLVIVDVSKKGGHVLSVLNTRDVGAAKLKKDQALNIAKKFLSDNKFDSMVPTYVIVQQNTAVVIFEYQQNKVLVYPDIMKVKVALDNGEVIGYEGTQFVMNHHNRKLPKPVVSMKQAEKALNPQLKIVSKRMAVIPLEDLNELMVYEFQGTINGDNFIVYINTKTGQEEKILKVINTNGGPVTI